MSDKFEVSTDEIKELMSMARKIAIGIANDRPSIRNLHEEELIGVANLAIAEAINNFNPKKGELRPRVKSLVRFRISDYLRSIDTLSRKSRRKKSEEDKKLSSDEYLRFDHVGCNRPRQVSINLVEGEVISHEIMSRVLDTISFDKLVDLLPNRSRMVIKLWAQGFPMNLIGKNFGIAESRVSQIVSASVAKLRKEYLGEINEGNKQNLERRNRNHAAA